MADINGVIKKVVSISGTVDTSGEMSGRMGAARDYNMCVNKPRINDVELIGNTELTGIVRNFTGTLSAGGWSDTAPYMQAVEMDGITEDMSPIVDIVLSDDVDTAKSEQEAWGYITKAVTSDGIITFICNDTAPEVGLNFKVKGV